jgi:hypothetical protein
MMRFSNFVCCSEDGHCEDPQEIVLLQQVGSELPQSLDGSSHWKTDLGCTDATVEGVSFVFGGSASSWLSSDPVAFSDTNPDSILEDDGTGYNDYSGDGGGYVCAASDTTCARSSGHTDGGTSALTAEQEIEEMIQSATDPVGKVHALLHMFYAHLIPVCASATIVSAAAQHLSASRRGAQHTPDAVVRTQNPAPEVRPTARAQRHRALAAVQGPQPRAREGHAPAQEAVRAGKTASVLLDVTF